MNLHYKQISLPTTSLLYYSDSQLCNMYTHMYVLYLLYVLVLPGIHFLVNLHKAMHHVQASEIISLRVLTKKLPYIPYYSQ